MRFPFLLRVSQGCYQEHFCCPGPLPCLVPWHVFLECCFLSVRAPQCQSSILIKRLLVGAIAAITESLDGNRVFIARLLNTNSHVLVHPVPYFDNNVGRLASLNYDIVLVCFLYLSM